MGAEASTDSPATADDEGPLTPKGRRRRSSRKRERRETTWMADVQESGWFDIFTLEKEVDGRKDSMVRTDPAKRKPEAEEVLWSDLLPSMSWFVGRCCAGDHLKIMRL